MRHLLGETVRRIHGDLRRVLRMLDAATPRVVRWVLIAILVEVVASVSIPYVTKQLVNAITAEQLSSGALLVPLIWLGIELGATFLRELARHGQQRWTQILIVAGRVRITKSILEKASKVSFFHFEHPDFIARLARARTDMHMCLPFALSGFTILRAGLVFVGCFCLLATTSAISLPLLVATALPSFLLDASVSRRAFAIEQSSAHRNRQGWYLEWLLTAESRGAEIRSLGAERWLVDMFERQHASHRASRIALLREHLRKGVWSTLASVIAGFLPYIYISIETVRGNSSIGTMLLFVLAFQQGATALSQLMAAISAALEQDLYVRNVFELLDSPDEQLGEPPDVADVLPAAPDLVFEDVWFTYPRGDRPVLRGLDLRIRAGETLAIVGKNGIGKTTIIKLLLGLYPLDRGRILLGGVDLASRPASWRRANIGVVFQDFGRFEFDVAANVGIGWCAESDDRDRIEAAIDRASARELVDGFSQGLDTALGTAFGGRELSGGQWQRVVFARLFMRRSRMWILDEPTSAMDPESEERIFKEFKQWTANRTAIIVAHRFSTIRIADRIAVIEDGQLAELGSHAELVARRGTYARMFQLQAQHYHGEADGDLARSLG